jgi:hypothetical protein
MKGSKLKHSSLNHKSLQIGDRDQQKRGDTRLILPAIGPPAPIVAALIEDWLVPSVVGDLIRQGVLENKIFSPHSESPENTSIKS